MGTKSTAVNPYPLRSPRFWHGMTSSIWWGLLAKNRFRVSWNRLHLAFSVTCTTPINDILGAVQHLIHGKKIEATELVGPPLFVLGHWRSGTTLMHELLELDSRFASPTTYQCFAPWHFLLTHGLMNRFGGFLLPKKRPMDNMEVSWNHPQEDEFALMVLGAPTPYCRIAFPLHDVPHMDTMGSDTFQPEDLSRWKASFLWFLKALTYHYQKPLIIKSPPHTGRLRLLAEMFPDAKFIHMIRDPRKLYPSTIKLWNALDEIQSLQTGETPESLHDYVIESLQRMYDSFETDRKVVGEDRVFDVHYEELVKDPDGVVREIYSKFQLGDSQSICEAIRARQTDKKDYQTNQHHMDSQMESMIMREWEAYAKRYGYHPCKTETTIPAR